MLKDDWIYKRGDIYLADLGTPCGSIQGGKRPVINIQNNTGSFFGPTLIVIPLTTELKKLNQPTHYVLEHQYGLSEVSMSEAEQPVMGTYGEESCHVCDGSKGSDKEA